MPTATLSLADGGPASRRGTDLVIGFALRGPDSGAILSDFGSLFGSPCVTAWQMAVLINTSRPALLKRVAGIVQCANYRALRAGLVGDLTPEDYVRMIEAWDRRCAYCQRPLFEVILEHMVPVDRGGGTTVHNTVPACGSCNIRKGGQTPEEWLPSRSYQVFHEMWEDVLIRLAVWDDDI